jgi:hypothetical protein
MSFLLKSLMLRPTEFASVPTLAKVMAGPRAGLGPQGSRIQGLRARVCLLLASRSPATKGQGTESLGLHYRCQGPKGRETERGPLGK